LANLEISEKQWANYMIGVIVQFLKKRKFPTGFEIELTSNVPIGAGLSSSAAIECSVAFGLNELFAFGIDPLELTYMAQKAEHDFAGVQCGIMDQFASMFGKKNQVVLLDCQNMEYHHFPINLTGYQIILFDTGVKHSLANSEYNTRRKECEAGIQMMQEKYPSIKTLRDANLKVLNECIDKDKAPAIYKRCKYVIEEIERTQNATENLKQDQLAAFGAKMFQTHQGLSQLYEVSCPELDVLIEAVADNENVLGARMMGGGFGGCTINIVKQTYTETLIEQVQNYYSSQTGKSVLHYIVSIEAGAHVL
jgi:galactokinase